MKNNFLSISKIAFLCLFSASFCDAQQSDNWTEKDWINYAKAQGNSYEFTLKSLKNIMADKEYEDYLDSMARTDVFSPLVYNGVEIRKSEIKPPVLTGTLSYYFLDGKLASQAEFINGVANGKRIYYYPNGNVSTKEVYKKGKINYADSVIDYHTNGQIANLEIITDTSLTSKIYSFEGGKLLAEFLGTLETTATATKTYFDFETNSEKTVTYRGFKNTSNFYDYSGKKVSMAKFYIIAMQEDKNHPFEPGADFPTYKSVKVEQSDQVLLSAHLKKKLIERKGIIVNWGIKENFNQCSNTKELEIFEKNGEAINYLSNNSDYAHSAVLDTLYCEPGKQIMRTAQTNKGKLNGPLKYYYPSGQLLAVINFKEDYPDGNFITYNTNGSVRKRSKYKMGISVDTTFDFSNNNILKMLTVWEDSVKHIKKTYWEDGITIQQLEKCTGEVTAVQKKYGKKQVATIKAIENRWYNKKGEEISKKQFKKQYPDIFEESTPKKTKVSF